MKKHIVFVVKTFLLLLLIGFSSLLQAQRTHVIKQGETLYRLTQIYKISAEDLCSANPGLSATYFPIGLEVKIPSKLNDKGNSKNKNVDRTVKLALILPFGLDDEIAESSRMLEFYQGFLLAVDTLKKQGVSVDLRVYDTGKEGSSIEKILGDEELKNVDCIIGGYYWGHIKQLSDFCRRNRIKMVLPFSSNDHFVANNPELFMINTPQPYLYPVVQDRFKTYFPNAQVFFLDSEEGRGDKNDFVESFKTKLTLQKVPYEMLTKGQTITEIGKKLKKKKENIFIPVSGEDSTLEEWMPMLTTLLEVHKDKKIRLFGYPEWQTYTGRYISRFYNLDTYIYSTFYTSNIFPSAINFKSNFRKWYHKDPVVTFPRYSMLGYDLGLYFITALSRYGTNFIMDFTELENVPTLQSGFRFERINEYGGFINKNVYFINFSKNMEIVKTELQ